MSHNAKQYREQASENITVAANCQKENNHDGALEALLAAQTQALLEIGEQLRVANIHKIMGNGAFYDPVSLEEESTLRLQPNMLSLLGVYMPLPLEKCDLSDRTYNALRRAGYLTNLEVKAAVEDGTIWDVRNIGGRAYQEIIDKLGLTPGPTPKGANE